MRAKMERAYGLLSLRHSGSRDVTAREAAAIMGVTLPPPKTSDEGAADAPGSHRGDDAAGDGGQGTVAAGAEDTSPATESKTSEDAEGVAPPARGTPDLSNAKSNVIVVDVREEREQAVSMLPGAIPAARLVEEGGDVPIPPGATVVAYCTIGTRSGIFCCKLQDSRPDLTVLNMRGSILAWAHEGGPLVRADGTPTNEMHVYASMFDYSPTTHTAIV